MQPYTDTLLQQAVQELLKSQFGVRTVPFELQGKRYWLKQTEKTQGWMKLLKANPQRALQREINILQQLNQQNVAVPRLVAYGDNYFVVEDVGKTLNLWLEDPQISEKQKMTILADSARALATLHQNNIVHGRPALRDITWQQGEVKFIDFETASQANINYGKLRDILVFIHSLYRSKYLSEQQIPEVIKQYQIHIDIPTWQNVEKFMQRFYWFYYLLRPFKTIAGSDLLALIGLFKYCKKHKRDNS